MLDKIILGVTALAILSLFFGIKRNEKYKSRKFCWTPGGKDILVAGYLFILVFFMLLLNYFE